MYTTTHILIKFRTVKPSLDLLDLLPVAISAEVCVEVEDMEVVAMVVVTAARWEVEVEAEAEVVEDNSTSPTFVPFPFYHFFPREKY